MNSPHAAGLNAFHAGRLVEAVELLGCALREQESSELWNDLGTVQFCCGRPQEAEHAFRRALELHPSNSEAAANLVALLVDQARAAEAAPYLATAAPALTNTQQESIAALVKQSQLPVVTVQDFLNAVCRLPRIAQQLPLYKKRALERIYFDSSSHASACLRLLRQLPQHLQPQAARALGTLLSQDGHFLIAAGLCQVELGGFAAAAFLLRQACDRNPADLYAEQLLVRCETAAAEMRGEQHPTFSGLDEYLARSFCSKPWEHFEVVRDGSVFMCCPGWLPVPIGNLKNNSVMDIWNSEMAQEIRAAILDGSFRFCSKVHCSVIAGRTLPAKAGNYAAKAESSKKSCGVLSWRRTKCETGPSLLVLAHDPSCNLACPSCRTDFLMVEKHEQAALEAVQNRLIEETFDGVRVLSIDGAGEVFYSKPSRNMLKKLTRKRFPNLKFHIITNGQLLNSHTFQEFDLQGRIQTLYVSMDAATESVYKIVRRGGDFARLLENLEFVKKLRSQGESFNLYLLFVVSAYNFRDMPEFVRLSKRFHATGVQFTAIRDFGHVSAEQFSDINIESPGHPEHAAFLEILKAKELHDPIVDLASISHFRKSHKAAGA